MDSRMRDHPLGIAARYNDAECEEHGLGIVIDKQGLELADVIYLAQQRALRALWIELGRDMAIFKSSVPVGMPLTSAERRRLVTLQAFIMDGILIGWRARGLSDEAKI